MSSAEAKADGLWLCVTAMLVDRPLAEPVFDAMAQVLTDQIQPDRFQTFDTTEALLSPDATFARGQSRLELLRQDAVASPCYAAHAMLHAIFRVAATATYSLRKRVVLDLTPVCATDEFAALLGKPGWQQALLDIVSTPPPPETATEAGQPHRDARQVSQYVDVRSLRHALEGAHSFAHSFSACGRRRRRFRRLQTCCAKHCCTALRGGRTAGRCGRRHWGC